VTNPEPAAMTVEEGFDFILSHFEAPIWPRTIFTPKEKQVLVYDKEEALARFKKANLLDCRINAYPKGNAESLLDVFLPVSTSFF
jgi:hypothetical protein